MSNKKEKIAAKKAAVLGNQKKNPVPFLLMAVCAVLVIGGGVLFMGRSANKGPELANALAPSNAEAGELTYPVNELTDGKARHFEHRRADGLTIRYFVMKSSDGVIRSAFDACDSCWRSGKGYRQEGDDMVCNNCNQRFPSVKVMVVKGGCNPAPLQNRVENGQVVIRLADIEAGGAYFDLGRRS